MTVEQAPKHATQKFLPNINLEHTLIKLDFSNSIAAGGQVHESDP